VARLKKTLVILFALIVTLTALLPQFLCAAQPPSSPQYEIELKEAWIPMPDGVRLAADLYMPVSAKTSDRFPVLLEYLPYRKTESRGRNYPLYSYFVRRGYVVARVDIRGTGNSEGRLIAYEYTDQEQEDGETMIDWLSKQPWSTGKVGMFGVSWGGFNSIHMAMRNPPALKAIIAIDATDDLYQDDVHFIDGIMHVDSWEMSQDLDNSRPGAPDYKIDENYFRNRFDTQPWMMTYKRQQRDGPFWDRTALKTRYESIHVPTFVIGGWYDGYRDSIPRMLQFLKAPIKAIVGPWSHAFPHDAYPKPQIEWRNEAVRWYDYWLKGSETGILEEPRFAVFIRQWHPPGPTLEEAPGQWRWEEGWPISRMIQQALKPQPDHTLSEKVSAPAVHLLRNVPSIGVEASGPVMWWGDVPPDQRPTDAFSFVYDTEPLEKKCEILGLPKMILNVSADAPYANWFARLSDVAPDGTVTFITGAGFNGTHRESAKHPKILQRGEKFPLEIEMHFTSWTFPAGHRIRLSISNSQWPMFWPSRSPVTTSLYLGGNDPTRLLLPVIPYADRPAPQFVNPIPEPQMNGFETLDAGNISGYGEIGTIEKNTATGNTKIQAPNTGGDRYPWGTERYTEMITHETNDEHPEKTSMLGKHRMTVELKERTLIWEAELSFRSDSEHFYYTYTRRLFENKKLIREKTWEDTIPRDFQ
jgi:putative CocE/NonD family hydrolase